MRAILLFPLFLQAWASRRTQSSALQNANQFDEAAEGVLGVSRADTSVDPLTTSAVALSLLFAATGSVFNEATACEAEAALSHVEEVEGRLFKLRAAHCVQAWKLQFQVAVMQLAFGPSVDAALPPPAARRGAEAEVAGRGAPTWPALERDAAAAALALSDLADGSIVKTGDPLETFAAQLDASLAAIMWKVDDLVVDVCHGVGKAEQALHAAGDDLSSSLVKAQKRQSDSLLQVIHTGLKMITQLSHIWQDIDEASAEDFQGDDAPEKPKKVKELDLWSVIKAAQADIKASEGVHTGLQKALLDNTLLILQALALTVVVPAKAMGLKEPVQVVKALSSLISIVGDLRKLASGKGELLPSVVKLLYHAMGEVKTMLKIFEPKFAGTPVGVAIGQAHVCLLAVSELLMMLDAVQSKREVHALAKRAERLEARALLDFQRRVLHEDVMEVDRISASLHRQEVVLSRLQAAAARKAGGATPSQASINLRLLELLEPFCGSFAQPCAQLLSTDALRLAAGEDRNLRAFSDAALAAAAARPVSEVVAVASERQALALLRLGFVDGGHWLPGVERHGPRHPSARLLFCRGCGPLDVSSIELGPAAGSPGAGVFALPLTVPGVPQLTLLAGWRDAMEEMEDKDTVDSNVLVNVEAVSLMLETTDQQLTSDLDAALAHFATRDTAGSHSRVVCKGTASHQYALSRVGSMVRRVGHALMGDDSVPAEDFPWYMSSVLIATTGRRHASEEASTAPSGPFHYLTITRGWECALRADELVGWTRLVSAASPRFTRERASIRTDLWLHKEESSRRLREATADDSVKRLRQFLGKQLQASLEAELPSYNLAADMVEARRAVQNMSDDLLQNRAGCWVEEQVHLPVGIWNAVVRLESDGPPDGKPNWNVAAEVSLYTEDEEGYYPSVDRARVWYRRVDATAALSAETAPSEALDLQARRLSELQHSLHKAGTC